MQRWEGGAITIEDAVASSRLISGDLLRTEFLPSIETVTVGLIRLRDRSLCIGPVAVHRFGPPRVAKNSVTWPIAGGLLTGSPGGDFTIESTAGQLKARVEGYRPMLPRPIYERTQLRLHHALVRIQLLRLAELAEPGRRASGRSRAAAAAIDFAVCAAVALVAGGRHRARTFAGAAIGYHLACWSTTGRTLGGRVMGQRVVAMDGSRVSLIQAALRLAALPIAALRRYPAHDDIAATTVIEDRPGH